MGAKVKPEAVSATGIIACLSYASVSMSLSYVTKALLSVYTFRAPFFIVSMQMSFGLLVVGILHLFPKLTPVPLPPLKWELFVGSLPQTFFYTMNVLLGFQGQARVNVPLYLCLRRTTLVFVVMGEYLLLNQLFDRATVGSIGLMALGALIAGWDSLVDESVEASWDAYVYVAFNNATTALFLVYAKKFTNKNNQLQMFGIVMYQSLGALPVMLILSYVTGDWDTVANFEYWNLSAFRLWLGMSATLGVVLTYTMYWANTSTSPLALTITAAVKDMISSAGSTLLFSGFSPTPTVLFGLAVSFLGSAVYGVNKLKSTGDSKLVAKRKQLADEEEEEAAGAV